MRRVAVLCAVAGAFAVGLAVERAAAQDGRFGAFQVSCSARNYCIAEAQARAPDGEPAVFKLERGPRPASKVFVTTGPDEPLEVGMRVDIDIAGLDGPFGVYGDVGRVYDGNEMTFAGPARRELVTKLRLGTRAEVTIGFGGATGPLTYTVPLDGLTLALLEIDRRQGRLGRRDAIVAWGSAPLPRSGGERGAQTLTRSGSAVPAERAEAAPAAPAAPSADDYSLVYDAAALPREVRIAGTERYDCALGETLPAFGAHRVGFSNGAALYIVPCLTGDANVASYVMVRFPGADAGFLVLDFFEVGDAAPLVLNPEYDVAAARITTHGYDSPDYDCGEFRAWRVDPQTFDLALEEVRIKADCDGTVSAPAAWPLVR